MAKPLRQPSANIGKFGMCRVGQILANLWRAPEQIRLAVHRKQVLTGRIQGATSAAGHAGVRQVYIHSGQKFGGVNRFGHVIHATGVEPHNNVLGIA